MPTMSSYDLKITGLVRPNDANPDQVFATFQAIMDYGTPWAQKFAQVNESPHPLANDTPSIAETWTLPVGSVLAAKSMLADGSTLNDQPILGDFMLPNPVEVVGTAVLMPRSVVAAGSTLRREPYYKLLWEVGMEQSPHWDVDPAGTPVITGTYRMLSLHALMAVMRPGALGEHWDNGSAPEDLWWFYKYKSLPWFAELMAVLVAFNRTFASRLAEPARVRDLKWYCGNGAGP
jgi:hypothetical protein